MTKDYAYPGPAPVPHQKNNTEKSMAFDYRDFLQRVFKAKYWIALCVALSMGIGYYKYKVQRPLFTSSTQVLFLFGNSNSAQGANAMQALGDLGKAASVNSNVNMNNELQLFKSSSLMATVVERLNLNTTYTTDGFGHPIDLYGKNPVVVTFLDIPAEETASLVLQKKDNGHVVASGFILNGQAMESNVLTLPLNKVVNTPVGKISVSTTTNFDSFPENLYVSRHTVAGMASGMAASVNVDFVAEFTSVMDLSYTDVNSTRARDVVNGLVESYRDLWIEEQNRSAVNTSQFIKERLAVIEKELNGIDSDISQVKRNNPTGDVTSSAQQLYQQSVNYDQQAYEASTQLSIAQFLRDHIQNHPEALIPANTGTSGSIESQIQEYNKMMVKRDNLLQNSTTANPVIAQMNSDLAANRSLILQSLGNVINTYQVEASRAQSRGNSFAGKIGSVPEQEKQILSIERQQKVKENLYLYLLQKREENELSRMVTVNNTRVLRQASVYPSQSLPLWRALIIGLFAGLALPLGIIYLMMQFNTKVERRRDLEGLTVPFLGEMPLSPKARKNGFSLGRLLHPHSRKIDDNQLEIVVKERSRSYINEAFRMIRTQLDFMSASQEGSKVIMLTSFNPGSGKTFISMNLAKSLALKGKKVVVVDVDLRRASLSKYAGNATQGVTNFLTAKSRDAKSLIVKSDATFGVDVLPVGAIPPNPVELLLSSEFDSLIAQLRQEYDYIVLDCPPYDLVADTSILARVADLTIFVIRARLFAKAMLPDLEALYTDNKLPHLALVLNGIDPSKSYYNNRYGYQGHNGYYINDEDDK